MARPFRVPLRVACRHSALAAGPFPCQAPPFVSALVSVVGAPAFLPRPPWTLHAAVGSAVQAVQLHRLSVAMPLGCGLRPRAVARVGSPGTRVAGRPPGRWCVPDPGWGSCRGPGDREMTARLVGRGAAGAPVRPTSWPVGPPCRTLPQPGGLGPRWCCRARRR